MDGDLALARRAVACPRWEWRAGMRAQWRDGSWWRLLEVCDDGLPLRAVLDMPGVYELRVWGMCLQPGAASEFVAADFSDPCTLGGLLGLVREAWGDPRICVVPGACDGWAVGDGDGMTMCADRDAPRRLAELGRCCVGGPCHEPAWGETEAEALVVVLEAAPVKP